VPIVFFVVETVTCLTTEITACYPANKSARETVSLPKLHRNGCFDALGISVGWKRLDLGCAHLPGMALLLEQDVSLHPVSLGLLGS
jgi:hypothetical protein